MLVLVITQVDTGVGGHIEDLDLGRPVRHDVAERLLDAAETLVRLLHDLDAASQRNLEMRRTFDRTSLEYVVRPDSNRVQLLNRRRQRVRIVVHLAEEDRLVEEL